MPSVWSLPRSLLVFTPRQYQIEIDKPYLFFPFSAGQPSGELTVKLPRVSGWTDRGGFRREFGPPSRPSFCGGNFLETGMEFSTQNGSPVVAHAARRQHRNAKIPARSRANVTLQSCFTGAKFVIINNNNTTSCRVAGRTNTLLPPASTGLSTSRTISLAVTPGKQISLVTDSQGDYFSGGLLPPSCPRKRSTPFP